MELSVDTLFIQASIPIKAVIVILAFCSIACWAVIIEKAALMRRHLRQTRKMEMLVDSRRLSFADDCTELHGLPAVLLRQGRQAYSQKREGESSLEFHARVERAVRDALAGEMLSAEQRLPFLATISSVAPFIGLFGTVWGIMHAFFGIAQSNDTSLAVVAPGIAEALFTTAAGLAAAIPASVAYNMFVSALRRTGRKMLLLTSQVLHAEQTQTGA